MKKKKNLYRRALPLFATIMLAIAVSGVFVSYVYADKISSVKSLAGEQIWPGRSVKTITLKQWTSLSADGWLDPETRRLLQVVNVLVALFLIALLIVSYVLRYRLKQKATHLKVAQQKILEQTELLRLSVEVAQAGIWDARPIAQTIYLSAQWYSMLGYPPEEKELPLTEIEHLVHPDDLSKLNEFIGNYIRDKGQKQFEVECRLRRADGSWCWVLSKGKAIEWDKQGTPLRIIGLNSNIQMFKEVQEKIAQSEARIREIIENAPFGAHNYTLDAEGRLIFSGGNPAADRILNLDHHSLINKTIEEAFPMLNKTNVPENYRKVALTGERWEEEVVSYEDERISGGFEVFAFQTGPGRMTAFFHDVTERKKAEEAVRKSSELLNAIFNTTADGILVVDSEGHISHMNQRFIEMWRIPEDLQSVTDDESLITFVSGQLEDPEAFYSRVSELYRNTQEGMDEIRFKDGRVFERYSCPMIRNEKEVGRLWDFRDVSEQKRVEEALKESEARFRMLFEMAPVSLAYFSTDGRILDVNNYFMQTIGYTPDDIPTLEKAWELALVDNELKQKSPSLWRQRVQRQGTESSEGDEIECQIRCKDGTVRTMIISTRLIRDNMIVSFFDITERKLAESERERLHTQLHQSQKLEAIGVLAGGVAHDFNNMLGVIIGYTELTMRGMEATDQLRKNLEKILDAGQRSANLTRQLLTFARKQAIAPVVFDLNESIESGLKMIRRLIGENIELTWLPGAGSCDVRMDASQLDQILINLCVNAKDAIADVGKIIIETESVSFDETYCESYAGFNPGRYVQLSVSDNGCGMEKETLDHIFEPFFTTKGIGQGTGMGLATVYGIVKQNEGFINVYSEPGKGTTFKIYIPLNIVESVRGKVETFKDIPRSKGESILLIEDDPTLLKMSTMMLQHLGYSVLPAATPTEAIRIVEDGGSEIQLFITDVVMPEMNGRDLTERLLAIRPEMKHLFMSGYTADVIAHQGVLEEGIKFIQKPFSLKDLAAKIREILD